MTAPVDPALVERMKALRKEGLPYSVIAKELGLGKTTVARYLQGFMRSPSKIPQHKVDKIRAMRDEGHTFKTISRETGVHHTTVRKYCRDTIVDAAHKLFVGSDLDVGKLSILQRMLRSVTCVACGEKFYYLEPQVHVRCTHCHAAFPMPHKNTSHSRGA